VTLENSPSKVAAADQPIRIEGAVTELYDIAVLPGVRRPMAASFTGPEINDRLTFEA
jgi:hypothetical protein